MNDNRSNISIAKLAVLFALSTSVVGLIIVLLFVNGLKL